MPTIITHGIVALALAAKSGAQKEQRRRLALACVACAILPDIDFIGFKLGIPYSSLFGHRGFTHSIFFALLVSLLLGAYLHRKAPRSAAGFAKIFGLLFLSAASHPFLDAMTNGGEGIAFLSPFSNHRYFLPWRPILVSPLGISAFFSLRGLLVFASELLLVILPLGLLLSWRLALSWARQRKVLSLLAISAWALSLALLNGLSPLRPVFHTSTQPQQPVIDLFTKQYGNPRLLDRIPADGLRRGKLVTNFLELQRLGLFNRRLEALNAQGHWASGFFPNWYGGIAGRWQDSNLSLTLRTVFGYGVPGSEEIIGILKDATQNPDPNSGTKDFLFQLAPTEKYDLALGNYGFPSTRAILKITHNAAEWPKFWYGICNGMAAAALQYEEPYRAVDVINPNGFRVRFHPNDVKALLGYALADIANWATIGIMCTIDGPESRSCQVNAGAFFLAAMNRIGIAKDGFIVDGFSSSRKQFYLFDALRLEVLAPPQPLEEGWAAPTLVKQITRVRFTMDFVSTLLADKDGAQPLEPEKGESFYKKVGRVVAPHTLEALLALDEEGDVIGGAWVGETETVPDVIFFPGVLPSVDDYNRLKLTPSLNWTVIKQIYLGSISPGKHTPIVDFSL